MIEIDENTGLPKLPEGQFWRVTNLREIRVGDNRWGLGHKILLIRKTEVTQTRMKWGIFPVSYKEVVDDVFRSADIRFSLPGEKFDKELTPENILRAAIEVMEGVEAEHERLKLIGDYPPKSLSNVD